MKCTQCKTGQGNKQHTCPPIQGKHSLWCLSILNQVEIGKPFYTLIATHSPDGLFDRLKYLTEQRFGKPKTFKWEESRNFKGEINENVYRLYIEV